MSYKGGMIIINQILDDFEKEEQIPFESHDFIKRILDDLHYDKKILKTTMLNAKEFRKHLFEEL